ncbi:DNA methyltransferase [Mammaliicoccus sciuri]|uniref:DNA methyltransferase n=1 Tax=Mammaliicoccus sciuri TaxID=1296 RepID=UPI001F0E8638|nr:DNA methyltransferase [Mammaliicoccus sciuri]MCH5141746.1 DNA adenine methylase [Mammaliicoccus sciuri]MEB6696397.1 DNA adenine methylase [Mammaliicoccus sciuri]WQK42519.1 DNA methyltransferase [Mammaliicoccus sciuri]
MNNKLESVYTNIINEKKENIKKTSYNKIHKYWSRKPSHIVQKYITKYSEIGDTILDPFCGSGIVGLESIISNRNFIGSDINPISLLISQVTLDNNLDFDKISNIYEKKFKIFKERINNYYTTDYHCIECKKQLSIKYIGIGPKFEDSLPVRLYCPTCEKKTCEKNVFFNKEEYNYFYPAENILEEDIKWIPSSNFPKKFMKDRFSYKGVSKVTDMYTKRNLVSLSLILDEIKKLPNDEKNFFLVAFTNTVLHSSKLKGINIRPLGVNNYWIPDDYIEENVWFRFEDRFKILLKTKKEIKNEYLMKNANGNFTLKKIAAEDLELTNRIDYIFTDPPYGDAIQYSELSFMWNAWINESVDINKEVIINPKQNKGSEEFKNLFEASINNISKLLKVNGYFTLCFQNKEFSVWKDIIGVFKNNNFKLIDINIHDTLGNSFNKSWSKFSPKTDIYLTFQKVETVFQIDSNSDPIEESINNILVEIIKFLNEKEKIITPQMVYDLTVAILISNYFENENYILKENFTIKEFNNLIIKLMGKE